MRLLSPIHLLQTILDELLTGNNLFCDESVLSVPVLCCKLDFKQAKFHLKTKYPLLCINIFFANSIHSEILSLVLSREVYSVFSHVITSDNKTKVVLNRRLC